MTKIIGAPTLDDALSVLGELVAKNEKRGEKNLIFCEDRLTLLAEGALLDALGGSCLSEVTTFARYLSGKSAVISKQGSVMAVADVLSRHREELSYLRTGAAQAVYETIAQLAASCVDPEFLRESALGTEGLLRGKLNDLALIFEYYDAFLKERGLLDESGYLAGLPAALRAGGLEGTHLFFVAFPSFTRQAREGIRAALECALDVTGIFLAGNADFYTNEGARIFRRVCEEQGAPEVHMAKCSLEGDALLLRDRLFSPERFHMARRKAEQIGLFTAADEGAETAVVAQLIKKYVAEGKRYREIAVLVPDKESFDAIGRVFSSYRIPFFADKKRAFSEHPFCRLVLSVLTGCYNGVLPADADAIASNVYFGAGGGEYRNYLLRYGGFRGAVRREIKDGDAVGEYDRETLLSCRSRMLSMLDLFPRGQKKSNVSEFVKGIRALCSLCGAEELTERLQRDLSAEESELLGLDPLEQILTEIERIAGERSVTSKEFAEMFRSGASALERTLIPQYSDAVFVGDVTQSRFARVRILFAIGLSDGLPVVTADTAVITDGEIGRLAGLRVEISPAVSQVNARARESLALNLCAFSEALWLSYPLYRRGEEVRAGEVVAYVQKLFQPLSLPELFPYDCSERSPAALRLLAFKDAFESGVDSGLTIEDYSSLYEALCRRGEGDGIDLLMLAGEKRRVLAAGELLLAESVSPTLLEEYFTCPYRGFALRGLRLREREERGMLSTDAGTFIHAVLQDCAKKFNEFSDETECRAYARSVGKTLLESPAYAALTDTDAGVYTGERLIEEGEAVSAAAYLQLVRSGFRVRETESQVALESLKLKGKVDRVDDERGHGFVRVIDYKTGSCDGTPSSYYMGRKLQLELYLKAASEGGLPAGAFYFPAADNFTDADAVKFRMVGFFSGEEEVLRSMDVSLQEGETSDLFEGALDGKYTDKGMCQRDFENFIDYAVLVSRRAEGEIREGNITPSPYDKSCAFCKLKSLCGFVGTPRRGESINCAGIVQIVRREKGEE